MALRPATPADLDDIIAVWLASTIAGQDFLPPEHWRSQEPEIRRLTPLAEVTVAEDEGAIVAFIALLGDLIGGLFTHPDHQGHGHGSRLVAHAKQTHDPLFVEVYEVNEAARAFYAHLGFVDHDRTVDAGTGLDMLILKMS